MFNPVYVEGSTLDDVWFKLLLACYEKGRKYLITDGSHAGQYRSALDDVAGFIHRPHERPLAPILPPTVPSVPTTEDAINEYFAKYIMDGYNLEPNEDYRYASFINGGITKLHRAIEFYNESQKGYDSEIKKMGYPVIVPNQVQWVIDHFKKAGFGNEHFYITVGYPESNFSYDVPYENETDRKTSPCLRGLDFRIIEFDTESIKHVKCKDCGTLGFFYKEKNKVPSTEIQGICSHCKSTNNFEFFFYKKAYLLTKVIYRSWDLWGGWPENMGGFTLLNEYVAQELGIEPGPLSFTCKSLHCYDHHFEILKMRLNK